MHKLSLTATWVLRQMVVEGAYIMVEKVDDSAYLEWPWNNQEQRINKLTLASLLRRALVEQQEGTNYYHPTVSARALVS